MTREYFEAISPKAVIDMAVLLVGQNDAYKDIIKQLAETECSNCKFGEHCMLEDTWKEMVINNLESCDDYEKWTSPLSCSKWKAK